MKVSELIAELQKCEPDLEVVVSKDGEGNGYSPAIEAQSGYYDADTTWSGEFYGEEIVGDEDYSQPSEKAVGAVCIWPTN
jgi:hypothetical protein